MPNGKSAAGEEADGLAAERGRRRGPAYSEARARADVADDAGSGRDHRSGNLRPLGSGSALCRARADAVVRHIRAGVRVCGAVLRGIRRFDPAGRQRVHLRLRGAGRVGGVDHRLGPDAGIRHGREHRLFRLVEPLHRVPQNLSSEDAAVARVRPLDCAASGAEHCGAADGAGFRPEPGHGDAGVSGESR